MRKYIKVFPTEEDYVRVTEEALRTGRTLSYTLQRMAGLNPPEDKRSKRHAQSETPSQEESPDSATAGA